jgi:hypothetical protein
MPRDRWILEAWNRPGFVEPVIRLGFAVPGKSWILGAQP